MYEKDPDNLDAAFVSATSRGAQEGAEQVAWAMPTNIDPVAAARALVTMGEIMQFFLSSNELDSTDPAPQDSLRSHFAMSASNVQQASLVSTVNRANRNEGFGDAVLKHASLQAG